MALLTGFPTDDGIRRLMAQPGDVVPRDKDLLETKFELAEKPYQRLFSDYRQDIRTAYDIAAPWWTATVDAQRKIEGDELAAIRASFTKRLAGPASHPKVVWIIRNYWLDCDDLNKEQDRPRIVYPEVFLLQWLIDAGETELVRLIACMPYWPIGLDENGNWC